MEFDTGNRQASIDNEPQLLSARETTVLELRMRSKGRVVSKKQVEDHIFGYCNDIDPERTLGRIVCGRLLARQPVTKC